MKRPYSHTGDFKRIKNKERRRNKTKSHEFCLFGFATSASTNPRLQCTPTIFPSFPSKNPELFCASKLCVCCFLRKHQLKIMAFLRYFLDCVLQTFDFINGEIFHTLFYWPFFKKNKNFFS